MTVMRLSALRSPLPRLAEGVAAGSGVGARVDSGALLRAVVLAFMAELLGLWLPKLSMALME